MTKPELPGPAWLFCPGDRPERFAKAAETADVVVLDLEDAVGPDAKDRARRHVSEALSAGDLPPNATVVRINAPGTPWAADDLRCLADVPLHAIMVPKSVHPISHDGGLGRLDLVALCETAAGISTAASVAADERCLGVAWGGQDLANELGASPLGPDGRLHPTGAHARMQVRFAAAAAGVPAIDTVRTDVRDEEGLAAEARAARDLGYEAKLVIHPRQVAPVREAFRPDDAEVAWARRVTDAVDQNGGSVALVDGEMVDSPVLARARRILVRATA